MFSEPAVLSRRDKPGGSLLLHTQLSPFEPFRARDNGRHPLVIWEIVMPLFTFACPQCRNILKSTTPISAGTSIRCPTCGASFAMPATTSSSDGPPAVAGKPQSRRALIAVLAILLLLGGLGAGGYFYYFRDRHSDGPHSEDPLAFVPPDAEIVAGIDFTTMLDDPLLGPGVDESVGDLTGANDFFTRCQKETGLSRKELLGHALVAGKLKPLDAAFQLNLFGAQVGQVFLAPTFVLQTTRPIDPESVARAAPKAERKTAHDKTYFELNEGQLRTLYMPSDRIIVLSTRPASELDALFNSDGRTPGISQDTRTLIRAVEASALWAVVPFEGQTRTKIQSISRSEKVDPDLKHLASALANSKGMVAWVAPDSTNLSLGATVLCTDMAAAQLMAGGVEAAWKEKKPDVDGLALLMGFKLPKTVAAYRAIADGLRFSTDGGLAGAKTTISRKAIAEADKELDKNPGVLELFSEFLRKVPDPGGKKR